MMKKKTKKQKKNTKQKIGQREPQTKNTKQKIGQREPQTKNRVNFLFTRFLLLL